MRDSRRLIALALAIVLLIAVTAIVVVQPQPEVDAMQKAIQVRLPTETDQQVNLDPVPERGNGGTIGPRATRMPVFADVGDFDAYGDAVRQMVEARPVSEYRVVTFNSNAFREIIRDSQGRPTIELRLLDEEPVTLVAGAAGENHSGWQSGFASWLGKVGDEKLSTVQFLVSPDGTVDGVIRAPEIGRIKIESVPNSPYHLIWSWDDNVNQKID